MIAFLVILALLGLIYGVGGAIANKVSKLNREDFLRAQANGGNRGRQAPPAFNLPFTAVVGWISGISFFLMFFYWVFIISIDGQSVGVVTTPNGVKSEALHTGWHFVWPWFNIHKMDKTVWVYTCANKTQEGQVKDEDAIWAPTSEGIKMGFDISASWRIDPNQAPWIFQNVTTQDGNETSRYMWLEEQVVRTKLKSCLALTVSEYTPIQAYSMKRQEIQNKTFARMKKELSSWRLILDQVDIREVYYNADYERSINAKKLAEQEALRLIEVTKQKNELLTQAKIEKDITIQAAEGAAKALQIKGDAIRQNPGVIQLNWIEKWDGALPTYMMGSGTNAMMMLPVPTK
jgi:regulator of protease activity HflC (stomatin/prohibitin superfamily)